MIKQKQFTISNWYAIQLNEEFYNGQCLKINPDSAIFLVRNIYSISHSLLKEKPYLRFMKKEINFKNICNYKDLGDTKQYLSRL